jgi:endoglucanase
MQIPYPFKLLSILSLCCNNSVAQINTDIRLNQEGYYTSFSKEAILASESVPGEFFIVDKFHGDTIFTGKPGPKLASKNSFLLCQKLNFTEVTKPGIYEIRIPGFDPSYAFRISSNPLHAAAVSALKGYYYQRVSMPLEPAYAGKWSRPAGHPDNIILVHPSAATSLRPSGTIISSPGGWYDAGDYNKYIVNSGITMGTLLSAYEDFPSYFDSLHTNIPESNNALPDIIDEVLYNLRWMMTMQDPFDGGVYHKCTNAAFDGMVMPGSTTLPRYVVQKSTAAALDFAAVTAQSARILKKFQKQLPGLSDSCLKASRRAWEWALKNPKNIYDQEAMNKNFEPKITTGAYGDNNLWDEWSWAASELFVSTKETGFLDSIRSYLNQPIILPSWGQVSFVGYYSLIRNEKNLNSKATATVAQLRKRIVHFADSLLQNQEANAFHTIIGGSRKDFVWGSNAVAANQGIVMINAYIITGNKKYIEGAISNADYILGRNATGYCFLTGAGTFSTRDPHHRPSVADGIEDPVPGLLAGGPNPGKQDGCQYHFSEPETTYLDANCSYASNEIAINWNAPLVYLLNALEVILPGQSKHQKR